MIRVVIRRSLSVLALCLVLVACTAGARQKTIATTLAAVDAARDGFVEYDRLTQQAIVDAATSHDDGRAKLDAYRKRRDPIVQGIAAAYRAIAIAAALEDDPKSLATMLFTASQLQALLVSFGCGSCAEVKLP